MSSRKATTARKVTKPAKPEKSTRPVAEVANGDLSSEAIKLAATIERKIVDGGEAMTQEALQVLTAALCRYYGTQVDGGKQFTPVKAMSLTPTDVMVTASGLLKAANLAVFELGMWQSWTGR